MKKNTRDNVARFLYDCGKVTFAVLVVGVVARKPFIPVDMVWGLTATLTLFILGIIMDQEKAIKEEV